MENNSAIILAGGCGKRMGSALPKQYLLLGGKALVLHAFEKILQADEIGTVVVVCDSERKKLFQQHSSSGKRILFAMPGIRRQDSVYNALRLLDDDTDNVLIHDGVRPFIDKKMIDATLQGCRNHGAACAAVKVKATIKLGDNAHFVTKTIPREQLWEIQTPQTIRYELLCQGFERALAGNIEVTDDVTLIELLAIPVKLIEGSYANIKITTPEDLVVASAWMGRGNGR